MPLGEINQKVLLEAVSRSGSFDLALPATFGVPDLAESGILVNLDKYAELHEPADFQKDVLYTIGDYYKGSLYGYETDGDTYLMFYNKPWLDNADEQKAFADKLGYPLKVPDTWEELDAMMAFFHRPEKNMFGGTLFRTQYFIAWEWWGRFHAKGFYPLADDLTPQINNEAGVAALEELIAASKYQYAGAKSNGLFENFEAYGQGTAFANIGWGGTQKYLNSDKSKLKGKLAFGLMPGGKVGGELLRAPYFNWGWNYVVSSVSREPEIGYLFSLYATSPAMSTIAVRDVDGYFDPFRGVHYEDQQIREVYTPEFLEVHKGLDAELHSGLLHEGAGRVFRRASRQPDRSGCRNEDRETSARRHSALMGAHHAPRRRTKPEGAVGLSQEQLSGGDPHPAQINGAGADSRRCPNSIFRLPLQSGVAGGSGCACPSTSLSCCRPSSPFLRSSWHRQ